MSFKRFKILFFAFVLIIQSCISYKKNLYFSGDQPQNISPIPLSESYRLRVRDIIQIKIQTPDIENQVVTPPETKGNTISGANYYYTDYIINDSGFVDAPIVGKVYVNGYTIQQVDSIISFKALEYSSLYTVEVRFSSFDIQLFGEFKNTGLIHVSNEYCTIYEAIAYGGDMTEYANKKKVTLIRSNPDGSKKVYHMDITSYDAFTYENYYIQPHDILYVAPQRAKVDKQNITLLSFTVGLISAGYVLLNIIN